MLCESEMEVEQHTCWNGQDVVERCVHVFLYIQSDYQNMYFTIIVRTFLPVLTTSKGCLIQFESKNSGFGIL